MDPEQKNNIIKILIILGALGVVALILIFGAYPLYQNIDELRTEIKQKRSEESNLKIRLEALQELEKNYEEAKKRSEIVKIALPSEEQMPELLVQLENIAGETSMGFLEITPQKETTGTTKSEKKTTEGAAQSQAIPKTSASGKGIYREIVLGVKVAGKFKDLKNYLKSIEKNIRILDIAAISIEKATKEEEKFLTISLAIRAYFQP